MQDLLSTAIEMHQAGQLGAAAQLYENVLAREATNPATLHLLGVLHHQRGDHARAVELIGQAVARWKHDEQELAALFAALANH